MTAASADDEKEWNGICPNEDSMSDTQKTLSALPEEEKKDLLELQEIQP